MECFLFSFSPPEKYYVPYYIRTELVGLFRPTGMYQLVNITDGKSHSRLAMDGDVSAGETQQLSGRALPLALSDSALKTGDRYIFRDPLRSYKNKELHTYARSSWRL